MQSVYQLQGRGDLDVVLLLKEPGHALAAGCAVARAFPLYHCKKQAPQPVQVTVHIPGASDADLQTLR
jgi:predicted aconitase with swiveling domain